MIIMLFREINSKELFYFMKLKGSKKSEWYLFVRFTHYRTLPQPITRIDNWNQSDCSSISSFRDDDAGISTITKRNCELTMHDRPYLHLESRYDGRPIACCRLQDRMRDVRLEQACWAICKKLECLPSCPFFLISRLGCFAQRCTRPTASRLWPSSSSSSSWRFIASLLSIYLSSLFWIPGLWRTTTRSDIIRTI